MAARFAVARRFFRSGQSADEIPVAERVAFRGSAAARCGFMTRHLRHAYARLADYPDNMRRHLLPLIASGNAAAIFRLPLPYAYVSANVQASFAGGGKLSFSTDGGRTWKPCDAAPIVRQKYDVCFKAEFTGAMEKIRVEALVEHNRGVLPYLVAGKNRVAASSDAKPGAIASISLGWQDATAANPKRKQWNGTGITYGTAQTATRDLDGGALNFDLEAGGNTAPKMLFIERAVRARR